MPDPAKILEVSKDASLDDIHAAFRKKATQYHPDLGGDKRKFQELNAAYEELIRRHKRETLKAKKRAAAFEEQKRKDAAATAESALRTSGGSANPPKPSRTQARAAQAEEFRQRKERKKAKDTPQARRSETNKPKSKSKQAKASSKHSSFFTRQLPLQSETCYFILASMLDFFLTQLILRNQGNEVNPVANYFYKTAGENGLLAFKLAIVAFVCVIAQIIAVRSISTAQRLLVFATIAVGAVVIYSLLLYSKMV